MISLEKQFWVFESGCFTQVLLQHEIKKCSKILLLPEIYVIYNHPAPLHVHVINATDDKKPNKNISCW